MTNDIDSTALFDPSVGGFQELDGRRVFVRRLGSGGPAVVFLPGAGTVGLDFFAIQREVSRFGTAVVYDRGGTGRSDPVPLPRTAASVATELHALLHAQGLAAPYVLVAHCWSRSPPTVSTPARRRRCRSRRCTRSATSSSEPPRLGLGRVPDDRRQTVLTIGQFTAIAHVSVRTVRHYHQVGLLSEPERDASGYRAQAVRNLSCRPRWSPS